MKGEGNPFRNLPCILKHISSIEKNKKNKKQRFRAHKTKKLFTIRELNLSTCEWVEKTKKRVMELTKGRKNNHKWWCKGGEFSLQNPKT